MVLYESSSFWATREPSHWTCWRADSPTAAGRSAKSNGDLWLLLWLWLLLFSECNRNVACLRCMEEEVVGAAMRCEVAKADTRVVAVVVVVVVQEMHNNSSTARERGESLGGTTRSNNQTESELQHEFLFRKEGRRLGHCRDVVSLGSIERASWWRERGKKAGRDCQLASKRDVAFFVPSCSRVQFMLFG